MGKMNSQSDETHDIQPRSGIVGQYLTDGQELVRLCLVGDEWILLQAHVRDVDDQKERNDDACRKHPGRRATGNGRWSLLTVFFRVSSFAGCAIHRIRRHRESDVSEKQGSQKAEAKHYTSTIADLGKRKQWHRALGVLDDMWLRQLQPDVVSHNRAISACGRSKGVVG